MNEELKVIISAETSKLKKGVQEASKEVSNFKQQYQKASQQVNDNFKKAGEGIHKAMSFATKAVAGAGAALVALVPATQEYRENQAKLATAFEGAGASANTAKGVYQDLYRVLGDDGQATEASAHLAQLTTNQEELSQWTKICQGVYATFGDSLPIEGLTEASNETAKVGQVTGTLADALNWAGINEDDFNAKLQACNNEAEREKLIRETLNKTYEKSAEAYEKNNEGILSQRDAQAQLQDSLSQIAEVLAPVVQGFLDLANQGLAVVVPQIQGIVENYGPGLKDALEQAGNALKSMFDIISDNKNVLIGLGVAIGTITIALGLYNAVQVVKTAMNAAEVTSIWGLVTAYTAQAAAMIVAIAPYVAIVAAIGAVIAIIVVCVKHWDEIKAKVAEVWQAIKQKTSDAVDAVKQKFEDMKKAVSDKVTAIKTGVVNKFNEIKDGISSRVQAVKDSVSRTFDKVKYAITHPIETAKNSVKRIIDNIKGFFNFTWKLPHIDLPHFSIKPAGWSIGDLLKGEIPSLGIEWYAKGGVFDSPTLFSYGGGALGGLGEAGAEAIVPLEKNTKWLTRIAEMLSDRLGNNQPIVLQVDGKTFAETTIRTINNNTKQTGRLGIKLF